MAQFLYKFFWGLQLLWMLKMMINFALFGQFHPFNNTHSYRVSSDRKYFNELNIQSFDFSNGFKCSDVYNFEKLGNLSNNIFDLGFHQDQSKWKPFELSESDSDRVVDLLLLSKNHHVLLKKLRLILSNHICKYVCRRCLNFYTSQNVLLKNEQRCQQQKIRTTRTSNESALEKTLSENFFWGFSQILKRIMKMIVRI